MFMFVYVSTARGSFTCIINLGLVDDDDDEDDNSQEEPSL
jgi:hypothetical protein